MPEDFRVLGEAFVERRRAFLRDRLPRPLLHPADSATPSTVREHLLKEAEDLYWNELAWEEITGEETAAGGPLPEMVFAAFLAFVDGLLPDEPARARRDVVEDILAFLGEQWARFGDELERGEDSGRAAYARALTGELGDRVLWRLYQLTPEERDALFSAAP